LRTRAEILVVENNDGDIRLLQEAFREAGCSVRVNFARNGQQALAFLRREGPFEASPRPAFILLDLNLPGASGSELLAEIKSQRALRQIPVIVLSTSTRAEDIAKAYTLGANCYISKPADLESLVEVARRIEAFWLGTAALTPEVSSRPQLLASRKTA
jgi:two-component system, chemotaxis family, response regulator Rcp1